MFPIEMIIDSHEPIMFPMKLKLAKMDAAGHDALWGINGVVAEIAV